MYKSLTAGHRNTVAQNFNGNIMGSTMGIWEAEHDWRHNKHKPNMLQPRIRYTRITTNPRQIQSEKFIFFFREHHILETKIKIATFFIISLVQVCHKF